MPMRHGPRAGFSIVEALVATVMMGIAGGLLSAAFTVATAARRSALRDTDAALALRTRVALLARRPCSAGDTAGVEVHGPTTVAWSAHRTESGWSFTDTVSVAGAAPLRAAGTVPCG